MKVVLIKSKEKIITCFWCDKEMVEITEGRYICRYCGWILDNPQNSQSYQQKEKEEELV